MNGRRRVMTSDKILLDEIREYWTKSTLAFL